MSPGNLSLFGIIPLGTSTGDSLVPLGEKVTHLILD